MVYPITDQDMEAIVNSFTYHSPKDDQSGRYIELREYSKVLAIKIFESCPPSRERSLAITNLEQAIMWANKAIACNE